MYGRPVPESSDGRSVPGDDLLPTTLIAQEVPVRNFMTRSARTAFAPPVLIVLGLMLAGAPAAAQDQPKYHNYAELTRAVQTLAGAPKTAVRVESIGKTRGGRDIWALEIANPAGVPPAARPALLIVAGFEGDHLGGSEIALSVAEALLKGAASDPEIKQRLDTSTIYVIPRVNPDGAE